MSRRVWVVERRVKRGRWRAWVAYALGRDARWYAEIRRKAYPEHEYRVVEYVPAKEESDGE